MDLSPFILVTFYLDGYGGEQGLPDLPDAQCRLFTSPDADQAIGAAVTQLIVENCSKRMA